MRLYKLLASPCRAFAVPRFINFMANADQSRVNRKRLMTPISVLAAYITINFLVTPGNGTSRQISAPVAPSSMRLSAWRRRRNSLRRQQFSVAARVKLTPSAPNGRAPPSKWREPSVDPCVPFVGYPCRLCCFVRQQRCICLSRSNSTSGSPRTAKSVQQYGGAP